MKLALCFILAWIAVSEATTCTLQNGEAGTCVEHTKCNLSWDLLEDKNRPIYCGMTKTFAIKICCPANSINTTFEYRHSEIEESKRINKREIPSVDDACGVNPESKLGDLVNTDTRDYAWLALLEYDDGILHCGGSLISPEYILTAAHCIDNKHGKPIKVRLSEYNTATFPTDIVEEDGGGFEEINVTIVKVDKAIAHPDFNKTTNAHDIGLVKLASPVTYSELIRKICLPEKDYTTESNKDVFALTIAGWGANEGNTLSDEKKHSTVILVSHDECKRVYPSNLVDDQICTDGYNKCIVDSGGPLMHATGIFTAIGVASKVSCDSEIPVVYTPVYKYLDWIKNIIKN